MLPCPELRAHLDALVSLGFTVEVSGSGELHITDACGRVHDGGAVEAPVPRQWAAVLGAVMSAGLTLDDLVEA